MTDCMWCKHNPHSSTCNLDSVCDFKTLAYEKDAIIVRLQEESEFIVGIKKSLANMSVDKLELYAETDLRDLLDKLKGVSIMSSVLQTEFGMSERELKQLIVVEKDSFMQKAKLASKLSILKKSRGGKKW